MRTCLALVIGISTAVPALADTVVATRTIRAHAVVSPSDVGLADETIPGGLASLSEAVGQEARVMIYAGRPIRAGDLGPPAIIDRNQLVTLRFKKGGLVISTEGRAMDRAGVGDTIRAVNMSSRLSVSGFVADDGSVIVTGSDSSQRK
ncbi:MAG: flagellar basal body P-ring formation chaperone FlgA [Pseudomonadota bacterium]